MKDFKVGDKVRVSNGGCTFADYKDFFSENGLEYYKRNWAYGKDSPVGDYTVVATGKHHDSYYSTLYLLRSGDGKIYIANNSRGYLTLVEKEENKVKYKTWEVVKMLTENHELVFIRPSDGVRTMLGDKIHAGEIIGKYLKQTNGEGIRLSDEWELVPQPIPFSEAVKAAIDGKKPTITLNDDTYTLTAEKCLYSDKGYWLKVTYENDPVCLSTGMIDGMWTVEEA